MGLMLRRDFLRRMAFAALATWFLDLPLPRQGWGCSVDLVAVLNEDGSITTNEWTTAWIDDRGVLKMTWNGKGPWD